MGNPERGPNFEVEPEKKAEQGKPEGLTDEEWENAIRYRGSSIGSKFFAGFGAKTEEEFKEKTEEVDTAKEAYEKAISILGEEEFERRFEEIISLDSVNILS